MSIPDDIREVIEAFDCGVLYDFAGTEEMSEDVPVVALGWSADPDAGLRRQSLTPWFDQKEELWKYVRENRSTLLAKASDLAD